MKKYSKNPHELLISPFREYGAEMGCQGLRLARYNPSSWRNGINAPRHPSSDFQFSLHFNHEIDMPSLDSFIVIDFPI